MIQIADAGNTTIRVARTGTENETQWAVYPYIVGDPTLIKFTLEQQRRINEMNVSGLQDREDLSGRRMNETIAGVIAQLRDNIKLGQNNDLKMVVRDIDIDPEGEIAKILKDKYEICSVENQISGSERKG